MKRREISKGLRVRQGAFRGHITAARFSHRLGRLQWFEVTWSLSHHPVTRHKPREARSFVWIDMFGRDW